MKRPRPTYDIKIKRGLTRQENLKAHMRKPKCPIRDSLHGDSSRVSSPLTDHPTAYGKFVMDKHMKAENTQKRYLSAEFSVSKSLIFWNINP